MVIRLHLERWGKDMGPAVRYGCWAGVLAELEVASGLEWPALALILVEVDYGGKRTLGMWRINDLGTAFAEVVAGA